MVWLIRIGFAMIALTAMLAVASCQLDPQNPVREREPDLAVPVAQLGSDIRPTAYSIELQIDPDQSTFSGETHIDVEITHAIEIFYLHGNKLTVDSVQIELDSGQRISATYQQVDPSGVARVTLNTRIDPVKRRCISGTAPISAALSVACSKSMSRIAIMR